MVRDLVALGPAFVNPAIEFHSTSREVSFGYPDQREARLQVLDKLIENLPRGGTSPIWDFPVKVFRFFKYGCLSGVPLTLDRQSIVQVPIRLQMVDKWLPGPLSLSTAHKRF